MTTSEVQIQTFKSIALAEAIDALSRGEVPSLTKAVFSVVCDVTCNDSAANTYVNPLIEGSVTNDEGTLDDTGK